MELEDLPSGLQSVVRDLKHASTTVQNDVLDSIESANTTTEAIDNTISALSSVVAECGAVMVSFQSFRTG